MSGCTRANSYAMRPTAWVIGPGSDMFGGLMWNVGYVRKRETEEEF